MLAAAWQQAIIWINVDQNAWHHMVTTGKSITTRMTRISTQHKLSVLLIAKSKLRHINLLTVDCHSACHRNDAHLSVHLDYSIVAHEISMSIFFFVKIQKVIVWAIDDCSFQRIFFDNGWGYSIVQINDEAAYWTEKLTLFKEISMGTIYPSFHDEAS